MEARAEEFADVESQTPASPRRYPRRDEIMPSVDQIRFFAGAARILEGRSAGEYMAGHTSSSAASRSAWSARSRRGTTR